MEPAVSPLCEPSRAQSREAVASAEVTYLGPGSIMWIAFIHVGVRLLFQHGWADSVSARVCPLTLCPHELAEINNLLHIMRIAFIHIGGHLLFQHGWADSVSTRVWPLTRCPHELVEINKPFCSIVVSGCMDLFYMRASLAENLNAITHEWYVLMSSMVLFGKLFCVMTAWRASVRG